jgi:hypothetical protein
MHKVCELHQLNHAAGRTCFLFYCVVHVLQPVAIAYASPVPLTPVTAALLLVLSVSQVTASGKK